MSISSNDSTQGLHSLQKASEQGSRAQERVRDHRVVYLTSQSKSGGARNSRVTNKGEDPRSNDGSRKENAFKLKINEEILRIV